MTKKGLSKSLHSYLSKIKRRTLAAAPPTKWRRTACSGDQAAAAESDDCSAAEATLADVDRFLYENFRSLYTDDAAEAGEPFPDLPRPGRDVPRGAVRASERFFVSPGVTGSLVEEARLSASSSSGASGGGGVPGGGVAVATVTRDPYEDFRRSMHEMVAARHGGAGDALDWEFMEELLLCYLDLNDRGVHRHVLRAFADVAVAFQRRLRGRPEVAV